MIPYSSKSPITALQAETPSKRKAGIMLKIPSATFREHRYRRKISTKKGIHEGIQGYRGIRS
jgi:hypothetical protein